MTFDRYLLRSFTHVLFACFVATFGLVIVIDLLENLDDFLDQTAGRGQVALVMEIVKYYAFQSLFFLERAGGALTVIAIMVVLLLFQRSGELTPLLAAGVPMYRVLAPLVFAAFAANGALILNQELLVPRFLHMAYEARGGAKATAHQVEPVYDHSTQISLDGSSLVLAEKTMLNAQFVLPAPLLVKELTILQAKKAVFHPQAGNRPNGWVLTEVQPAWDQIGLTDAGRKVILPLRNGQIFVASPVDCEQLFKRNSSFTHLSTTELISRIHCPAYGAATMQRLVVHVHGRFTQPLLNLVAVLIAMPLMLRRESIGVVYDSSMCGMFLAALFGIQQGCQFLGNTQWLTADLAAWLPVVCGGTVAAWLSGWIRT